MKNESTKGNWTANGMEIYSDINVRTKIADCMVLAKNLPHLRGEALANAELMASAPELKRENEELKIVLKISENNHRKANDEIYRLNDLNAELLEALKIATDKNYKFGLTPYADDFGMRWMKYEQRVSELDYNKIESLISKLTK